MQAQVDQLYQKVTVRFCSIDLTRPNAAQHVPSNTHLLMGSYFLMEMEAFAGRFSQFFTETLARLSHETLILFLDSEQWRLLNGFKHRLKFENHLHQLQHSVVGQSLTPMWKPSKELSMNKIRTSLPTDIVLWKR
eukprot:NODE_3897_length_876_cov_28.348465_g3744_i0.p2 GENE.NODE_3897_length_876_cov_28.348465_g3744_i0~~NODE_3897_length_876_cov_28.348465_g3744_i0.p2  ORF type:complete len:135 (+),score=28.31 NODE_3897_length_876_cov_28.348465_g3744_i0:438-842(+)